MREQILPDGSRDYGQGVIGPSAQDIVFFKNPNRPPLDHFPTRQALTTTAIIVTPFAVSGCVSITPASTEGNQNLADTQTSDPNGEASIGDRFDAFLTLYNDKQTEIGVVDAWIDALGIPKSAIKHNDTYDFLSNPLEDTTAYFSIIPNDGIRPSKGDIAVISPTSDYANGTLGIATGDQESFEGNLYERVFMHYNGNPNTIDSFSPYDILAWLKPNQNPDTNNNTNGQGDQGNDVLVARKESVAEHFQSFIDKYSGKFVEKNDASNLNQCMDLVTAWADELGIPRDAVTGILYAKNLYLSPKKSTKDYFEIIPYEGGSTPQVGDVVVWDEGIGGVAGHAAIANGDSSANEWLSTFSQNYPTGTESHMEDFNFDHILGWLRPKGFDSELTQTEPPAIPEFENGVQEAKYLTAKAIFEALKTPKVINRDSEGKIINTVRQSLNLSDEEIEEIALALARGEEVIRDNPIEYHSDVFPEEEYLHNRELNVAYINNLSMVQHNGYRELSNDYTEITDADRANGLTHEGNFNFSFILKIGTLDLIPDVFYGVLTYQDFVQSWRGDRMWPEIKRQLKEVDRRMKQNYGTSDVNQFTSWFDIGFGGYSLLSELNLLGVSVKNGRVSIDNCGYGVPLTECGFYPGLDGLIGIPQLIRAGVGEGYQKIFVGLD